MKTNKFFMILLAIIATAGHLQAQNIEFDKQLGEKNAKLVEEEMGIYHEAKMTAYVAKVGEKLVSNLESPLFDYEFRLVPDPAPNAFALPGGYIFVTTGILALLESEDELACILGHEIIHSNDRHSVKQMRKKILPGLLEIPGNIVGVFSKDLGNIINAPIQTSNALLFASYSRKFETKADMEGVVLAANSGYDPNALIDILSRMNVAIETLTGDKEKKSYFADHPYSPKRISRLEKKNAEVTIKPTSNISSNFLREFDGVLFGDSPAKGVIRDNTFLHPDINFYIAFPEDWKVANQNESVGAYEPEGNAAVVLGIEEPGVTPQQAGRGFYKKINEQYKAKAVVNENYPFNGKNDAYYISIKEVSGDKTAFIDIFWLPLNGLTYRIVGLSMPADHDKIKTTAHSLRVLNKDEKGSFVEYFVKVVPAHADETLATLSKRTNNHLRLDLTAIMNDHEEADKLAQGELIKIVAEKPYKVQ